MMSNFPIVPAPPKWKEGSESPSMAELEYISALAQSSLAMNLPGDNDIDPDEDRAQFVYHFWVNQAAENSKNRGKEKAAETNGASLTVEGLTAKLVREADASQEVLNKTVGTKLAKVAGKTVQANRSRTKGIKYSKFVGDARQEVESVVNAALMEITKVCAKHNLDPTVGKKLFKSQLDGLDMTDWSAFQRALSFERNRNGANQGWCSFPCVFSGTDTIW